VASTCKRCIGFAERRNFVSQRQYCDHVRQLIEIVEQGTFRIVWQSCSLEEALTPAEVGDLIGHDFECTQCGRRFHLSADNFHGGGGWDFD
jgi:hypothetical protein